MSVDDHASWLIKCCATSSQLLTFPASYLPSLPASFLLFSTFPIPTSIIPHPELDIVSHIPNFSPSHLLTIYPLSSEFCLRPSVVCLLHRYRCNYLGRYKHPGDQRGVEYCSQVNFTGQLIEPGGNRSDHDQHTDDVK